ncbi:hypothetical protein OCAR_7568 [Afipia carboxidovorans OM5]|nr:hypothetical protein OCAR_7568 [Afipia carboxidovorans OM5]
MGRGTLSHADGLTRMSALLSSPLAAFALTAPSPPADNSALNC